MCSDPIDGTIEGASSKDIGILSPYFTKLFSQPREKLENVLKSYHLQHQQTIRIAYDRENSLTPLLPPPKKLCHVWKPTASELDLLPRPEKGLLETNGNTVLLCFKSRDFFHLFLVTTKCQRRGGDHKRLDEDEHIVFQAAGEDKSLTTR